MPDQNRAGGIRIAPAVAGGAVVVLLLLLVLSEAARFRQAGELKVVKADVRAALEAVIAPATVEEASRSVYMIRSSGDWHGTAFVIDRDRGLLGTAAHVVEDLDLARDKIEVINRSSERPMPVKAFEMHAGYKAFAQVVNDYAPIDAQSSIFAPMPATFADLPLDVALIVVDPIDPETGANVLGPSLPMASRESLLALKPGDAVAMIGLPEDMINSSTATMSAAPRSERGIIGAVVSPIDVAGEGDDPATRYLIIHRMPVIGGHSGSPLLNGAGEIIGVNTHSLDGTVAGGDGVAQRADLLADLLDPAGAENRLANFYAPDWKRRLSRWPAAAKILPHVFYAAYGPSSDDPVQETVGELTPLVNPPFESSVYSLDYAAPVDRFIYAPDDLNEEEPEDSGAGAAAAGESLEDDEDEDRFMASGLKAFVFEDGGQYAIESEYLSILSNHVVFALDFVTSSTPYCRLTLYYRQDESSEFTRAGASGIPFVELDEGGSYEFILRRSESCRDSDNKLLFGVVSWPKPEEEDEEDLAGLRASATSEDRDISIFGVNVVNAFNCFSPLFADRAACRTVVRASALRENS